MTITVNFTLNMDLFKRFAFTLVFKNYTLSSTDSIASISERQTIDNS